MELNDLWGWSLERLASREGCWKTAVLATKGDHGPEARTVVVRAFGWPTAQIYSDRRAGKVADLIRDPRLTLLYYDPQDRVQLRLRGEGRVVLEGAAFEAAFTQTPEWARKDYSTSQAPGSRVSSPEEVDLRAGGLEQFALVDIALTELDYLALGAEHHWRARFQQDGSGHWVVP